jgi:hypothetical protein
MPRERLPPAEFDGRSSWRTSDKQVIHQEKPAAPAALTAQQVEAAKKLKAKQLRSRATEYEGEGCREGVKEVFTEFNDEVSPITSASWE